MLSHIREFFRKQRKRAKVKFPNAGTDSSEDLPQKQPMGRDEMLDLLHRCQNGEATCMFTLKKIEEHVDAVIDSYHAKS